MKTELKRSYDFDEIIERRHTNALNTDGFRSYIFHAGPEKKFPYKDEEFVRMWVADMEFAVAPEIVDSSPPKSPFSLHRKQEHSSD